MDTIIDVRTDDAQYVQATAKRWGSGPGYTSTGVSAPLFGATFYAHQDRRNHGSVRLHGVTDVEVTHGALDSGPTFTTYTFKHSDGSVTEVVAWDAD